MTSNLEYFRHQPSETVIPMKIPISSSPLLPPEPLSVRLRMLRGKQSRRTFSASLGIKESTLRNYEQGASLPNAEFIAALCKTMRVSANWLLLGLGPAALAEVTPESSRLQPAARPGAISRIPVVGAMEGWHYPSSIALSLPVSPGENRTGLFAVLAMSTGLQPEGILPANVVICDSNLSSEPGDIVFVRRKDGTATLRKLVSIEDDAVELLIWDPPSEQGLQSPRLERVPLDECESIATASVIHLKT